MTNPPGESHASAYAALLRLARTLGYVLIRFDSALASRLACRVVPPTACMDDPGVLFSPVSQLHLPGKQVQEPWLSRACRLSAGGLCHLCLFRADAFRRAVHGAGGVYGEVGAFACAATAWACFCLATRRARKRSGQPRRPRPPHAFISLLLSGLFALLPGPRPGAPVPQPRARPVPYSNVPRKSVSKCHT